MSRKAKDKAAEKSVLKAIQQKMYLSNIDIITSMGDRVFAKWIFVTWYKILAKEFSTKIKKGDFAVDVGCGPGNLLCELGRMRKDVKLTGIDISPSVLRKARKVAKKEGHTNIEFIKSGITEIPLSEGLYSFGFSTFSFHLWKEIVTLINEIYRIMAPGSEFVVIDFNGDEEHETENLEYLYELVKKAPSLLRYILKEDINWGFKKAGLFDLDEVCTFLDKSLFSEVIPKKRSIGDSGDAFLWEVRLLK
jgi:ubiquinone/menaquinone biosynthesis C-methylase UbiE